MIQNEPTSIYEGPKNAPKWADFDLLLQNDLKTLQH